MFSIMFTVECVLKLYALGWKEYSRDALAELLAEVPQRDDVASFVWSRLRSVMRPPDEAGGATCETHSVLADYRMGFGKPNPNY